MSSCRALRELSRKVTVFEVNEAVMARRYASVKEQLQVGRWVATGGREGVLAYLALVGGNSGMGNTGRAPPRAVPLTTRGGCSW